METIWLLYDDSDFEINRGFAEMLAHRGATRSLALKPVLLSQLTLFMDEVGTPRCLLNGQNACPRAVLSRQRDWLISRHFELMGIPVFNNSLVCRIANDKRITHQFLNGLPMPRTTFLLPCQTGPSYGASFPLILKPASSHGGDRVCLVQNEAEWQAALAAIRPACAIEQDAATESGRDLRVYVVGGRIIAGVLRTAAQGVVSNFKRGGHVALHAITDEERLLVQSVIDRFDRAGAPLVLAGVDLLFHHGRPVIGEVEDVVGSRMLYQTSDIDIASLFLNEIVRLLARHE